MKEGKRLDCSVPFCFKEASRYRPVDQKIQIGDLKLDSVLVPLCKEHDDIAFSKEYYQRMLKEAMEKEKRDDRREENA